MRVQSKTLWASSRAGATISEAAAALVFILPLIIVTTFVTMEACQAYMIHSGLSQAAYWAARDLAIRYGCDPSGAQADPNSSFQKYASFANIVNSPTQFSQPVWNTTAIPPTVTVRCTYESGQHGLAQFPNPDPLHLGGNLQLQATATAQLE